MFYSATNNFIVSLNITTTWCHHDDDCPYAALSQGRTFALPTPTSGVTLW